MTVSDKRYLSVRQIVESPDYPFTNGQLKKLLWMRRKNGLERAVRKIGKRIYLNKKDFDDWIDNHQKEK